MPSPWHPWATPPSSTFPATKPPRTASPPPPCWLMPACCSSGAITPRHCGAISAALAKPEEYDLSESIQKVIVGDHRQTYSLMARAALEAGQYDDALALYRETYKDLPESDEAQLAEASVAERRRDYALAIKLGL